MLTIQDVMQILKKRLVLIISIVVVSTLAAGIVSQYVLKPQFKTSMKLFIGKETNESYNQSEIAMYQKLMSTYAGLFKSEDLVSRAIKDKTVGLSTKEILDSLQISTSEDDQFMSISIVTLDAAKGKVILELINTEFMKTSKELIPNGNVHVVTTPKVPTAPFAPNKKMNVVVAFAMGLMVAVTLALFLEYLDNSVKKKEDVEKLLGVPVIGMVPEFDEKTLKKEKQRRVKSALKHKKELTNKEIVNKDTVKKEVINKEVINEELVNKETAASEVAATTETKQEPITYEMEGGTTVAKRRARTKK